MFICEPASYLVFGSTTMGICLYTARLRSLKNHGPVPMLVVWTLLIAVTTVTMLQASTTCSRSLLTWGSALMGVYCFLAMVESCLYVSHRTASDAPSPAEPTESLPEQVRTGTVLTVGRLAATVTEADTRRQFYAPLNVFGVTLQPGDAVSFRADPTRTSGRHCVGSESYERQYCVPAVSV